MSEQDAVRNLAGTMVSTIAFWLQEPMQDEYYNALKRCMQRFRSIYRRPWRFQLQVVCKSASETLAWLADFFGGDQI